MCEWSDPLNLTACLTLIILNNTLFIHTVLKICICSGNLVNQQLLFTQFFFLTLQAWNLRPQIIDLYFQAKAMFTRKRFRDRDRLAGCEGGVGCPDGRSPRLDFMRGGPWPFPLSIKIVIRVTLQSLQKLGCTGWYYNSTGWHINFRFSGPPTTTPHTLPTMYPL